MSQKPQSLAKQLLTVGGCYGREKVSFLENCESYKVNHVLVIVTASVCIWATQVGLFWVGEVKDLWGQTQVGRLESECDGVHCMKSPNNL